MLFIHGTITGQASLTSCLLVQDLFWVLSLPRWQLFIHSIPRRNVIPPQLLWNGAQPQFYFRHLRCVVGLQPYASDIYMLLQNHRLRLLWHTPVRVLLPALKMILLLKQVADWFVNAFSSPVQSLKAHTSSTMLYWLMSDISWHTLVLKNQK